ncbi:AAA family ATPase [Candidatus Aerophobetes bacterium]|nr:AAA family ATPase [Candidatus Aerophobetes bacterium]
MQVKPNELSYKQLRKEFDLSKIEWETTEELLKPDEVIGQDRAIRAIEFGLNIQSPGYNIYVAGMSDTGRTSIVKNILRKVAGEKKLPSDWCYVNNFEMPDQPLAISLPPKRGKIFKKDMDELIHILKKEIPKAFRSDDYKERREVLLKESENEKKTILSQIEQKSKEKGFKIIRTPFGFTTVPVKENGSPLKEKEYQSLAQEEKERIENDMVIIQKEIAQVFEKINELDKKSRDTLNSFNREVVKFVVERYIKVLEQKYTEHSLILKYLGLVAKDMVENMEDFLKEETSTSQVRLPITEENLFTRYAVNLIVDNSQTKGAPVVIESNPTYGNIFGRIERKVQFGVFMTDFTKIKSGALQRANGGYLVLNVERVFMYPFVWDTLKRALQEQQIKIEDISEQYGFVSTSTLKPEPLPLDVKVIMIGRNFIFNLLHYYDEDFKKIFKVRADFDWEIKSDNNTVFQCAKFLCKLCNEEKLKHFDKSGFLAILEYSTRLTENQGKLSLLFGRIADVAREANYQAQKNNSRYITKKDVEEALEEKEYRSNIIKNKIEDMIAEDTLYIDTEGAKNGQINGLSVYAYGEYIFGRPSRITAQTFMGNKGVINIEREAKLSGKTHDKGVLILSGYLGGKYGVKTPLSISATLTFEQSYSFVEGDSASTAELFAILSSLSELPIKQAIAVTGSVNQRGEIQPIGGVNEKIEGFFDTCKIKGLTAEHGVIIPKSNANNLMLKKEVVEAVKEGKFHIYPISSVDEGMEILTDVPAGERGADSLFPEGTINRKVEDKLFFLLREQEKLRKLAEKEAEK